MGLPIPRNKYALEECLNIKYTKEKKTNEDDSFQSFERAGSFGW